MSLNHRETGGQVSERQLHSVVFVLEGKDNNFTTSELFIQEFNRKIQQAFSTMMVDWQTD